MDGLKKNSILTLDECKDLTIKPSLIFHIYNKALNCDYGVFTEKEAKDFIYHDRFPKLKRSDIEGTILECYSEQDPQDIPLDLHLFVLDKLEISYDSFLVESIGELLSYLDSLIIKNAM